MQLKPLDLPSADGIWHNLRLSNDLETILENACLVIENGITQWWGHYEELPSSYQNLRKQDGQGMLVTPGLVDCHGHWVYAGTRAKEFAMRLEGARYEEIAQAGGGIVSTVRATREASVAELFALTRPKVAQLLEEGVVALECKSGYGLSLEHERKQLQTARLLAQYFQVDIQNTFLGAHALPPEFQGRSDDYIDLVCHEMLPKLVEEGLVDAVDVFCENIAFTLVQTQKVFETAKSLGIPVKVHAEQLSNMGATALAAQYKALSADHIEFLDEKGVKAMAESGMTAVLLPGAFYFLRETQHPPIELLRTYKVPMAISTDHNPGTSPTCSLLLMLNMACTLFRLTVPEGLAAVTRHAAGALGWEKRFGSLHLQHKAQFVLWNIQDPKELANTIGINPAVVSVRQGKIAKDIRKQFTL